jgi:hypothetical protein
MSNLKDYWLGIIENEHLMRENLKAGTLNGGFHSVL